MVTVSGYLHEEDIEVFQLIGHPAAQLAYGWEWVDSTGETQCIVVLKVAPIGSAFDAVHAAIACGQLR